MKIVEVRRSSTGRLLLAIPKPFLHDASPIDAVVPHRPGYWGKLTRSKVQCASRLAMIGRFGHLIRGVRDGDNCPRPLLLLQSGGPARAPRTCVLTPFAVRVQPEHLTADIDCFSPKCR